MRWLLLPVLLLVAGPAGAAPAMLGDASISYRADRTVTVDGRSYSGTVAARPGEQRHEQDLFGLHEYFLLDIADAHGYLVLPTVKTYVSFPFPALMAELDAPDLLSAPEGEETIGGVATTKYRINHEAKNGDRARGELWLGHAGVLMRLEVTVTRPDGRSSLITMQLSHVKAEPVDPALFELPPGLTELPAEALGPLLGGNPR